MLSFLSDEWVAALDEAVAGRAGAGDGGALTVRQVVTGGPAGDRSYVLWFDGDRAGARLRLPAGAEADVTFTCDWDTAVAIATGKERAQAAFLAGRLRLGGDSRALIGRAGLVSGLDDALAEVRARTDVTG